MNTTVGPRQLDAIREVVNIGAGHAATNLSTLTGLRVMISVPRIHWGRSAPDSHPPLPGDGRVVMIDVPIVGVDGTAERASLLLSRETALRMVALMMRRTPDQHRELGALEQSALKEMGNIVCAAYVGVLGEFLGRGMMIGAPRLQEGAPEAIAREVSDGFLIETDFEFLDTTFEGWFVLSHTDASFASLLDALGLSDGG